MRPLAIDSSLPLSLSLTPSTSVCLSIFCQPRSFAHVIAKRLAGASHSRRRSATNRAQQLVGSPLGPSLQIPRPSSLLVGRRSMATSVSGALPPSGLANLSENGGKRAKIHFVPRWLPPWRRSVVASRVAGQYFRLDVEVEGAKRTRLAADDRMSRLFSAGIEGNDRWSME